MQQETGKEYDFVIIGSGLGGLACAYILASEGHRVIVLEKNHQIGGHLQVYSRDKTIFDTGVHYVGSMDEGENLYQFFKYFGILDKMKLKRLDDEKFDVIRFDDGSEYSYGQGYDQFKKNLIEYFPDEKTAIETYCNKIKETCKKFPLYNLESSGENYQMDSSIMELNAYEYIASITKNAPATEAATKTTTTPFKMAPPTLFFPKAQWTKLYPVGSEYFNGLLNP